MGGIWSSYAPGWPSYAPQYGDLRPTSLKNIQNLQKSSKSRQNSIDADIDDDRMDADRCRLMPRMIEG